MDKRERKHDWWEVVAPHPLEDVRPCDLVVCRECGAVRHVGDLDLETRSTGVFSESVEGVFCPGCGQRLFDRKSWNEHRQEQEVWDDEQAERWTREAEEDLKEEKRSKRSRPPAVAVAEGESA